MVTIIFEAHSTTVDNEADVSSGWNDSPLSALGIKQSQELGQRYRDRLPDAVFCSDLQRSYNTAEIAFGDLVNIVKDGRLREINYGDFNGAAKSIVDGQKVERIYAPFPNGESYEQAAVRMKGFLKMLLERYEGKTVMVIGHRATQYGLDHWINGVPYEVAVSAPWKWQPGWTYTLQSVD